jgi:SsrA-binding protein
MSAKKPAAPANIARNRKAAFEYELLEKIECGIVLYGPEVKSLRDGSISLDEAYARIERDELWLCGFHIGPYSHNTSRPDDPLRKRKLLVHARELKKLAAKVDQKGLALVATRVYFNDRGIAKVEIAVARGKKVHDKRESIKAREQKREMDRAVRRR